ncbi:thiol:disulfide interchange protein TlpA [Aquamicrobium terrae]|uniref:Thiol-disulfide isomerase/thioredoxin n=1 Tax=Aquamicrobium terrae TaxID=1324945 RepID=A0ABV2MWL9_9HYPH
MADGRKLFPTPRLILAALVAGAAAGALAVYVSGGLPGNNAPDATASVAGQDRVCAAKAGKAKAVAAAATGHVAAMLPADPPQSLAALAFSDPDGKPATLAGHAGKTVLVNLWATWCAPCRAEMPALDELQQKMGGDRFEVVAINVDTGNDDKPKAFLDEIKVSSLAYYSDHTMGVFNDLKSKGLALGLPVTVLVDDEGCLLAHMNGPAEWSTPDAFKFIEAALGDVK